MEPDLSISGERVGRILDRAAARYGWPDAIVTVNGPEFTSKALDQWAWERGIRIHLIQTVKPVQNAFVESMNGKFRTECLSKNWSVSLADSRSKIAVWREDYNNVWPHRRSSSRPPNNSPATFLPARPFGAHLRKIWPPENCQR